MKNKVIEIPDDLTDEEELMLVMKALGKSLLLASPTKAIGNEIKIKESETTFTIKRVEREKPMATHDCSMCGTIFDLELKHTLWTNYGGKPRAFIVCSEQCANTVIDSLGGDRVAKKKKDLVHHDHWAHSRPK